MYVAVRYIRSMPRTIHTTLTRREREILDILYRLGRAGVSEVVPELSGKPSYSTVRAQLRVLEDKGHVRHEEQDLRYVYRPSVARGEVRQSVLKHIVDTFFDGAPHKVMAALLGGESRVDKAELDRIAAVVEKARKGGRG
jgi:BlaI family transcriptional regulator, penicillinase repressor